MLFKMNNKSFSTQTWRTALFFMVVALQLLDTTAYTINVKKVRENSTVIELEPPILEYHFHTYFDANNPEQVTQAIELRNEIITNCVVNKVIAVPQRYHYDPESPVIEHRNDTSGLSMGPAGPHPIPQFQTWVPIEHFAPLYEWFIQKHLPLNVLIHPLTIHPKLDHTVRAVFMGKAFELKVNGLHDWPTLTSQYPHIKLGYAKSKN